MHEITYTLISFLLLLVISGDKTDDNASSDKSDDDNDIDDNDDGKLWPNGKKFGTNIISLFESSS